MTVDTSTANAEFWNEPCGSRAARMLGVTDASRESLKKFDDWYLSMYPYLASHLPLSDMPGKDVLEVGLGYGTVAQMLAEAGCNYVGLDIAKSPVALVNHRLSQNRLEGRALCGTILQPPFDEMSFDYIIAIGSLHHTGDLGRALSECFKLLRPGGSLILMVYSAYSYRRWKMDFRSTFAYWLSEMRGYRGVIGSHQPRHRAAYDANTSGLGAPHTDFISKRSLAALCDKFSDFGTRRENIGQNFPFGFALRRVLLATGLPKLIGLDLYGKATR